ncbi:hypothetical protein BLNAU_24667 [Blattamonas nauphoetae]|uniref:Uncharacterized protein n=1 Tax=Blattamonas nauphoetae TaxID=2049346 RepID=A0ABQ9WLS6_9EUKA|nr:hypothetical protein BLNAU_24667 [Blattamonas nauphoetae]
MIQKTTYSGTMCTVSGKTVHGTNIVKLIKDKYVFFDAQSAYVPSPLFSEARMLPEQLSKSCCLCASLENALDAVLAALRGPSVDGTGKPEFGSFGLPLLLSFAVSVFFPIDAVVLSLVARSLLAEHAVAGIPCSALAEPSERHC